MIISHRHKYIFVRPFKVSGMSTEKCLKNHLFDANCDIAIHTHGTLVLAKSMMDGRKFDDYLKITMERNPWDKVVSWFFWEIYKEPNVIANIGAKDFIMEKASKFEVIDLFSRWLPWRVEKVKNSQEPSPIGDHYYVVDDEVAANEFILFESRENDILRILKIFNVDYVAENDANFNTQSRPKWALYSNFYNDELKDLVASIQEKQIMFFGYEF